MKSKFTWIFTLLLAFFIQFSFAQEKTITGVVTDESGMPLPGVNVLVEGTNKGVLTDFDGRYTISAEVGQKLVFSFIGQKTRTMTVGAASTISVKLEEDVAVLSDVIIEGYRTTTRPRSNVAVTTITSETIEGRPNASFIQTLQGQIPGLNISTGSGQPGANSTVILRGMGSINGNIEPLYVIDGVPLNSDNFRSINPNDIESISVLKDAGATSIYGNRGANGVIIVKTKRGGFDQPLNVKYTSISSFTTMQDNDYGKMNARQLLSLEKTAGQGFGASLTDEEIASYNGVDTDWYDFIFRTGITQNHVLSLTSGSKNMSSFTSFGYFDQEGIVRKTDLKRFNFRNNLTGRSDNDKFNYGTSITVNYSVRNEASNLGQGSVNINPLVGANNGVPYLDPALYTNGLDLFNAYTGDGYGFGGGTLLLSPLMLMDILERGVERRNELKMIGNLQGSYKITDNLTLGATLGSDYTETVMLRVQDPQSFNSYLFQQPGEEYLGFQNEGFTQEFAINMNTSLNYNKTFGENHTLDVSVFSEYYKAHLKSFSGSQPGLDPKTFEPGNGAGFIPHNPGNNPQFYVPFYGSGKATAGLFSYFGTLDYDYASKYGFGASVRRDASYRFAETNRWGTFWSVSGRWNIDKEDFMQNAGFDLLKLRASYGTTGNQNISGQSVFNLPNASRTLFAQGTGYGNFPSYAVAQLGNADLKWETIAQANIGVDFELLNRKLRGTFDVYRKTTTDLYQSTPISAVNATYTINGNNGSLRNSGVEALLAYDVVKNDDFTLTLNFNGSYNKNEITDISNDEGLLDLGAQIQKEGGALFQYYMVPYAGVNPANGNLLFVDGNGNLTENPNPETDRRETGKSPLPTYQGGFGFDAQYKGFYLTTQFSFVADIYRLDNDLANLHDPSDIGVFNKSTDLLRAWTPENTVTDIPALDYVNQGADADSDRYLTDASYVRLRYTSLGYNFPKNYLDRTFMSNLRIFAQAENLFTWSKWRGWDAESPRASDVYQYPTPRIISLGLEVEF